MELESHNKQHNLIILKTKVTLSGLWKTFRTGTESCPLCKPGSNFSLSKYLWNEYMSV